MHIVKDKFNNTYCARCYKLCDKLTVDHFIPRKSRLNIDRNGNMVGLCVECNREKADRIVLPSWYTYLPKENQDMLMRYFRYASLYIRENCTDEEVLKVLEDV